MSMSGLGCLLFLHCLVFVVRRDGCMAKACMHGKSMLGMGDNVKERGGAAGCTRGLL